MEGAGAKNAGRLRARARLPAANERLSSGQCAPRSAATRARSIRQGRPEAKRGKGRKGKVVTLYIKAAKPLRDYLDGCTFPGLLFVTEAAGKPIPPTVFRHSLRAHLDAIGLKDLHFHAPRHTTATALAASDAEIQTLLGHQTRQMAERYTKRANQKRLADAAVTRLEKGWNR
jgi:integrase